MDLREVGGFEATRFTIKEPQVSPGESSDISVQQQLTQSLVPRALRAS